MNHKRISRKLTTSSSPNDESHIVSYGNPEHHAHKAVAKHTIKGNS